MQPNSDAGNSQAKVCRFFSKHVSLTERRAATGYTFAAARSLSLFVVSRLSAGVAGKASLATPVVGVISAAIQLHEVPSVTEIIGMGLIVVALGITILA